MLGGGRSDLTREGRLYRLFRRFEEDGNLLPQPLKVTSITMGVAQRMEVIVDFRPFAGKTVYFENRLEQVDGRGPTGNTLPAGAGNLMLQFRVKSTGAVDNSADPATIVSVVALLSLVTLAATAWPAWRASRIDPVIALRAD